MVVPPELKVASLSFIVISLLSALGSLRLDSETAKIQATLLNLTIWKRGLVLKFACLPQTCVIYCDLLSSACSLAFLRKRKSYFKVCLIGGPTNSFCVCVSSDSPSTKSRNGRHQSSKPTNVAREQKQTGISPWFLSGWVPLQPCAQFNGKIGQVLTSERENPRSSLWLPGGFRWDSLWCFKRGLAKPVYPLADEVIYWVVLDDLRQVHEQGLRGAFAVIPQQSCTVASVVSVLQGWQDRGCQDVPSLCGLLERETEHERELCMFW